ncbi:MAG: tail fiber domain-containing protein, partial [Bacteroidota bacterium]
TNGQVLAYDATFNDWFPTTPASGSLWSEGTDNEIFYTAGNVGIGTNNPEDDMGLHITEDVLIQTNQGALHLGFPGTGNRWRLSTFGSGANLAFRSRASGTTTYNTQVTFTQDGAVEVGDNTTIESGTVSLGSNNIAESGENLVVQTRQMNVGTDPGVYSPRSYIIRAVQNGTFGFAIFNTNGTDNRWEQYVSNAGNLTLYRQNTFRGFFDDVSGNYNPTSDRRLKTNIVGMNSVLPSIMQLAPKQYNYKTHLDRTYNGLIAQELQEVFPEVVRAADTREEDDLQNVLTVDYGQLTVLGIKAIQEQQEVIEAQAAKIDVQTEQIATQANQIQSLEARLARLEALLKD